MDIWYHGVLLLGVALFSSVESTHFRGGILGWRPAEDNNKIVIFWQVAWRRSWDTQTTHCNTRGEVKNGEGVIRWCQEEECDTSGRPSSELIHGPLEFDCTDFNEIEDWSTGVGSYEYQYTQTEFTIQYAPLYSNSYWINLQNYGDAQKWKLVSKVNISVRADKEGRLNSSPITSMIPVIKVQEGCSSTINIPARDPDGDVVRCRWADDSKKECPDPVNGARVCGPLSDDSYLDPDTCQITFNATGNPGWYAVSVIIEDFALKNSTEAISQIPLQFLIKVFPLSDICRKISIIEPTGSCDIIRPGEHWQMDIVAKPARPSVDITQISTSSPSNVAKTSLMQYNTGTETLYNVTLAWTPTDNDIGEHFVCFFATDDDGVSSDQQCVTLIVTNEQLTPPSLLPSESVPNDRIPLNPEAEEMIFVFSTKIQRPKQSKYVSIYKFRGDTSRRIARYDTSRSRRVQFPEDEPTTVRINITNLNLRHDRIYYVELDSAIVLGHYSDSCSATRPNDGAMWFFATAEEPTTTVPPTTTTMPPTTTTMPPTTTTMPPPTPEAITAPVAECSSSGIRVLVPKLIVGDVDPGHLHFNDPNCIGLSANRSVILMETGYDRCGTITRVKPSGRVRYLNTIFSEPLPVTDTRITREREIQINIVCETSADGVIHAVFDPDTSPLVFDIRETASFNFALHMFHDETFLEPYTALDYPIPVQLRERLYFSVRASNPGLHISIDSCKATPQADPAAQDYFYFILNRCFEDSTVELHQSPSLSEVRFSIESFEFHRHGMLDTIFISCDVNICSQNDVNSVCQQGCSEDLDDQLEISDDATRGDGPLRKRRSSVNSNAEIEHSARIPLMFAASNEQKSGDTVTSNTGLFDITVLVVNICLLVIVSVATVVGIKLTRKLTRFKQSSDNTHVEETKATKSIMRYDNKSYEIDI
ncbi:uncharacterized protein [Antedon mediterranea]|uniref:uncharacterized protein n=1 Tax=Antedon mediterranea TaxID=105859 RepID=UPI003AF96183